MWDIIKMHGDYYYRGDGEIKLDKYCYLFRF
ncbi:MAG: hypothetical protein Hyperionvirus9_9 [Hyperionvirus sp.]|uniref:Uncharacterized protein n=1 Tax=Hyperionvirus sp. TaxID=2487770 RepID=A0A3G5A932_9VIRU|nr:MAG: hypothetical protein Hyperionvirus9_9 [Hyperionvirus sp.]